MLTLLKKHFGYETFRPMQAEIVEHCAAGKDALVLMPTGGGKSLCYQLPALQFPGITVVVSPLVALMKDQVDALRANGIPAAFMNSTVSYAENARTEMQAANGLLKLIYLAPERLAIPRVQDFLQTLPINLIAVDEAHCISEWGHDFRPDYRNLRALRNLFPGVPMMALTATANPRVREDIIAQLDLGGGRVFQSSFNRANLTYRVLPKKRALDQLLAEINALKGQPAIVYCFSRKGTEKVAADLRANGVNAAAYHAGLSSEDRSRVQEQFIRDQTPVIVATIAFGMGIDKPDVRLVVHMDLPKSVEGYYQETGRAGRDGLPSDCLLFYSGGDRFKHEFFIREMGSYEEQRRSRQQLDEMVKYCEQRVCRRAFLLGYFGEEYQETNCGACDFCLPPREALKLQKSTVEEYDEPLFERLRALRRRLAEERGVPPYVVFGDKTLQEMARQYPQSVESMSGVFGVGKEKLAQYGETFAVAIREYAKAKGIEERAAAAVQAPKVALAKRAVTDTIRATVTLLAERMTLEQIAKERGVTTGTILSHLEKAREQGVALETSHLAFPSRERLMRIADAFAKSGTTMLAPVRARLGEEFGFDEIRYARFLIAERKLRG